MYTYRALVRSVYDADTIRVDIDLGMEIWLRNEPLRLYGINAPEVRGGEHEAGIVARDWLRTRLPEGQAVTIRTFKDSKCKYGRLLALIYLGDVEPDESINSELVREGLAREAEY